jgi:hypothetical protein
MEHRYYRGTLHWRVVYRRPLPPLRFAPLQSSP